MLHLSLGLLLHRGVGGAGRGGDAGAVGQVRLYRHSCWYRHSDPAVPIHPSHNGAPHAAPGLVSAFRVNPAEPHGQSLCIIAAVFKLGLGSSLADRWSSPTASDMGTRAAAKADGLRVCAVWIVPSGLVSCVKTSRVRLITTHEEWNGLLLWGFCVSSGDAP